MRTDVNFVPYVSNLPAGRQVWFKNLA